MELIMKEEDKDTYTCDLCGETFFKEWTDEQKENNLLDRINAGDIKPEEGEELATVCEPCFFRLEEYRLNNLKENDHE